MIQIFKTNKAALYTYTSVIFYVVFSVSCFSPENAEDANNLDYVMLTADHSVVAEYSVIPSFWLAEAKKMWLNVVGESHSAAYRRGLELLAADDGRFTVSITESGSPEAYTSQYLRAARLRRSHYASWAENTGEDDFWTTAAGVASMESHVTYLETNHLGNAVIGFAWCWDMTRGEPSSGADPEFGCRWYGSTDGGVTGWWGLDQNDSPVNCQTYCQQVDRYNTVCRLNGHTSRFIFTTGTVDNYTGESGYQGYLKNEYIRNYVKAGAGVRILFDYADILCYSDSGELHTFTWAGHTYPIIHPQNDAEDTGHISNAGALRLAKAQWWLLARIAGWDGKPVK